jgi:pimeloyl-ACP methyl ester carboxylesterase
VRGRGLLVLAVTLVAACAGPGTSGAVLPLRGAVGDLPDPLVVCVHGWCADGSYFDAFRRAWPGAAVAVDLPGHGRAPWNGEAEVVELGREVAATVDALGVSSVVWVGHGLGGAVALSAAAQCATSSRGLLALDCLFDLDRELSPEPWAALVEAYRADFDGTLRAFARQAIPAGTLEPGLAASIAEDLVLQEPAAALAILSALPAADPAASRAVTRLPIHAVLADLDPAVDADGNRAGGAFSYVVLERSGHFLHLERPAELAGILAEQLALWGYSPSR